MLTLEEHRRLSSRFDGSIILDTNLKPEVLKATVNDLVEKIQTKLKRVKSGGKIAVLWGEVR